MANIIKNVDIQNIKLDGEQTLWTYCALDCAVTQEIWQKIKLQLDDTTSKTYQFELDSLKTAMAMTLKGLRVDTDRVKNMRAPLKSKRLKLERMLHLFSNAVTGKDLNHASPKQLQDLFYVHLGIPKIMSYKKGQQKVSTDREALEHLRREYPRAKPFANAILALRDIDKQLSVLETTRDKDNRIRCSYNVAGTETGRWSSSEAPWGTGTNLQNITKDLRSVFIPDEGKVMFYADLEQAESRVVAYITGDDKYIQACESGDLHTTVVKMVWKNMGWSGDAKQERELAEKPYYLHFSYRDMCKRAGHGTNYGLSATSLGRHLQIKIAHATRFQLLYYGGLVAKASVERWHKQNPDAGFDELLVKGKDLGGGTLRIEGAFEGIRQWHESVQQQLLDTGTLITPLGRRRQFWNRLNEATTLRAAIAFVPQSTIGDLLNMGLYRVWNELHDDGVEILGQVHDAILGQVPIEKVDELMPKIVDCMTNPIDVNGKTLVIPSSVEVGHTWKDMKTWERGQSV